MAVTAKAYLSVVRALLNKEIDFDSDSIKVMLCTSAYVPDQDVHDYKNDITNEVIGTGYTAGGAALATKVVNTTPATNTVMIDSGDTVWASSTLTARYAVIYEDTGTASTSALIGYVDFGVDVSSSNGSFTIVWDAAGILTFTVA